MAAERFRYKAFISYSHRDQAVARWLQRALESYRAPRHLIGRETPCGTIQRKLGAVFRDRDELPVAADLTGQINEALAATQFLIVLCSTTSAQSKWVNQEVINFKRLKGAASIIAVIVDGEPYATASGNDADECFAPSLRFQVDAQGNLTDTPAEPIAADLRPGKDGRRMVKLKVLAGLLGVGLDDLVQRENLRRQRFMTAVTFASLAGIGVMGALTFNAIEARNEAEAAQGTAERRRGEAEDLIEFMLTDLQVPLREIGRTKELNKVTEKVVAYYAAEDLTRLPDDSLGRRARALHLAGETKLQSLEYQAAENVLRSARDATAELLRRDPENPKRLFEHGQSEYWLGNLNFKRAAFRSAIDPMQAYVAIADKLSSLSPRNREAAASAARAKLSLAGALMRSGNPEDAVRWIEDARMGFDALVAESSNAQLRLDIANLLAFKAEALRMMSNMTDALAVQNESERAFNALWSERKADRDVQLRAAIAARRLGRYLYETGAVESAEKSFLKAHALVSELLKDEATQRAWQQEFCVVVVDLASLRWMRGQYSSALALLNEATPSALLHSKSLSAAFDNYNQARIASLNLRARERLKAGDYSSARAMALDAANVIAQFETGTGDPIDLILLKAEILATQFDIARGHREDDPDQHLLTALSLVDVQKNALGPRGRYLASILACKNGQFELASSLRSELRAHSYRRALSVIDDTPLPSMCDASEN